MNYQEFIDHWKHGMDCEGMVTGLNYVLKRAKEEAKNLRRAGYCSVAERAMIIDQLTAYHMRCKAALKRAA